MKTKKESYKDGHSTINVNKVSKPINIKGEKIEFSTGNNTPSKAEILEEMKLHNQDEVGIDNQWTFEDAEYFLLLSDKYHTQYVTGSLKP